MIDNYRGLAVFVAVADAGSFSAAARRLKLSTSVVSHHVSRLESKLGVSLLFRSTRSLALTSEGTQILDAARRMVEAGEEAIDSLASQIDQPVGTLRITLPAFGGESAVHNAIWEFSRTHPMVALSVSSSDKQVDLISEGFDLAIRLGQLANSDLKSRRIGVFERKLVASPSYLANRPTLEAIEDLMTCEFVSIAMLGDELSLERGGETVSLVPENSRLEVDSISAAIAACVAGLGVQHLPASEIKDHLMNGRLVEVLPEWRLPKLGVYAVWPDAGPQKQLTRRLIDFLVAAKVN